MEHKESVALYLSGLADNDAITDFENNLLSDAGLLERFIASCEQVIRTAPAGFTSLVMDGINSLALPFVPRVPVLSRKLCAAVCFSSAAAIALFSMAGYERYVSDFLSEQSGRFIEIVNTLISR
jgi:hypothetical protein